MTDDGASRRFHDRVRLEPARDGRVAWLVMERGDRPANAFDAAMVEGMVEALDALDEGTGCLVLRGEGEFSVGADLAVVRGTPRGERSALINELAGVSNRFILGLRDLAAPTVAAVNGTAAGGGLGFALACDVMAVHADAVLDPAYARIAFTPDNSTPWFLTRALGPYRARDLLYAPRAVDAEEAERLGLASRVVAGDPEAFDDEVGAYAAGLARVPSRVQATTRSLVDTALTEPLAAHLERQREAIAQAAGTRAADEGIEAFFEGRPPAWSTDDAGETGD